jgi:Na+/H+-dicarboxylate symporter
MIGNAVATVVVARWENELDRGALEQGLTGLKAIPQVIEPV